MTKTFFCPYCGNPATKKTEKCSRCTRNLEEFIELANLVENSVLIERNLETKNGKTRVRETWLAKEISAGTENYSRKDFSTFKFMILIICLMGAIWVGADYLQRGSEPATKVKVQNPKERIEQRSELYLYGYDFVEDMSSWQLNNLFIYRWLGPGENSIGKSSAEDWCRQLPKIVIGLTNKVGFPPNPEFVDGCSDATTKIRF